MRQRRRLIAILKAGFSRAVSDRALIRSVNVRGSLTQDGKNPQRIKRKCLLPFSIITTGIGWVGATLKRGGKLGCSTLANSRRSGSGAEAITKRLDILC